MPITEGTQPVAVQTTGAWSTPGMTTASFTPEAGALLVALVSGDGHISASPDVTVTMSDSVGGGTWTELVRANTSNTAAGGYCGVWVRDSPGVSMTVTAVGAGDISTGAQLVVRTLIGAKARASQNGATFTATKTAATLQGSVTAGTGNRIYGSILDYDLNVTLAMLANTVAISNFADATNGDTWWAGKSNADTAGTATYGSSTSANGMVALAEILAAPAAAGASSVQAAQPFPPFTPPWLLPSAQPFQELGDQAATTQIGLTDSGAATDTISVLIDYGSPVNGPQPFPPFRAPWIDPSAIPLQLQGDRSGQTLVSLTDSGSGDDSSLTVTAAVPATDSGAAADALTVAAAVPLTDAGTAVDSLTVDIGSDPNQAPFLFAPMFVQPSYAALQLFGDTAAQPQISLSDAGAASDALTVTAAVPLSDTAAVTDAIIVAAAVPLADSGVAADTVTVAADVPLTDTGTATETFTVSIDSGYAAGPLQPPPFGPAFAFTIPGATPMQLLGDQSSTPQISLSDAAAAADALTVTAAVPLADTGAGSDALMVAASTPLTDAGAGADTIVVAAAVPLADSGTATETFTVTILDTGTAAGPQLVPPFGPAFAFATPRSVTFQLLGNRSIQAPHIPAAPERTDQVQADVRVHAVLAEERFDLVADDLRGP